MSTPSEHHAPTAANALVGVGPLHRLNTAILRAGRRPLTRREGDEAVAARIDLAVGLHQIREIARRPMGSVGEKSQALQEIVTIAERLRGDDA